MPNEILAIAGQDLRDSLRVEPRPSHPAEALAQQFVIIRCRNPALQILDGLEEIGIFCLELADAVLEPRPIGLPVPSFHLCLNEIRDRKPKSGFVRRQGRLAADGPGFGRISGSGLDRALDQALPTERRAAGDSRAHARSANKQSLSARDRGFQIVNGWLQLKTPRRSSLAKLVEKIQSPQGFFTDRRRSRDAGPVRKLTTRGDGRGETFLALMGY